MSDAFSPSPSPEDESPAVEVPLGDSMPVVQNLPVLLPRAQALKPREGGLRLTTLAEGMSFSGQADIDGSVAVAGEFQGDIRIAEHSDGHVTVSESGVVVGDVRALHISVLGQTTGLLDAAGGEVLLHGSSSVSGRIRYSHLQVNGADLNAQLERVRGEGDPHRQR